MHLVCSFAFHVQQQTGHFRVWHGHDPVLVVDNATIREVPNIIVVIVVYITISTETESVHVQLLLNDGIVIIVIIVRVVIIPNRS